MAGTPFLCYDCYERSFKLAVDIPTRARELTHEGRVRNLQQFVMTKKELTRTNKEKLNESRTAAKPMEDSALALLKSLNFVSPAYAKPVRLISTFILCITIL